MKTLKFGDGVIFIHTVNGDKMLNELKHQRLEFLCYEPDGDSMWVRIPFKPNAYRVAKNEVRGIYN